MILWLAGICNRYHWTTCYMTLMAVQVNRDCRSVLR